MMKKLSSENEIDPKEVLLLLWRERILIALIILLSTAVAAIYSFRMPEQWTARGKIIYVEADDYAELHNKVSKFDYILNSDLSPSENDLYNKYIKAFNSTENKLEFMTQYPPFLEYIKENGISLEEANRHARLWYQKINATPKNSKKPLSSYYTISVVSDAQQKSYDMLTQYSSFIEEKIKQEVIDNLNETINLKKEELINIAATFEAQAKNTLELERQKIDIALKIASKAKIKEPLAIVDNDKYFPINLGENVLAAKKQVLNEIDNLAFFEPRIRTINTTIDTLSKQKPISQDIEFEAISYLEEVNIPRSKDKPRRALIILSGMIIGSIISIIILMLKQAMRPQRNKH